MILSRNTLSVKKGQKWTFFKEIEVFLIGVFHRKTIKKTTCLILWKEKNDFKQKKIEVLKRAIKWTFFKGVSP